MLKAIVVALILCTGVAAAEPPADAPRTVQFERAQLLTTDAEWIYLDRGVCLNEQAAINVANSIQRLEQGQGIPAGQVALVVGGALVLGLAVGVAAAHVLPAK